MNKTWFRRKGGITINLIPCSIEGWIWSILVIGSLFYFLNSNFQNDMYMFAGFGVTILVGLAVAFIKSE